ncbi:MAG: GNAT family N-acetyltransferase [Bacilli bacterium]|nr:GNAT family N-acetyltransferase [Bacilli bacterium]
MNYEVINDVKPEYIHDIREILGWKDVSIEQLQKGIDNTMCKVTIKNDEDIIAVGRLVGDYSCKGVLSDIMVNPKYQKQGFGKIVVTSLLKQAEDTLKSGELFMVEATPTSGNRDFYVKCGMKYKPENQDGVYVWLKK